jgi:hypothetical protein
MSDFKSKLPDLKELGEMTSKLFTDIKHSVCEIISTYKENHAEASEQSESTGKSTEATGKPKKQTSKKPKPDNIDNKTE